MANIIITGASRGIGYEMAKQYADGGHQVLALSRNIAPLAALNNENITAIAFDLAIESDVSRITNFVSKNWSQVDVLVNNAGRLLNKPFLKTTQQDWLAVYQVNVFGVANVTREVLPFMKKDGHVVTISSMGGVQGSMKFPGLAAYSSSKAAVITMTELWAEEYKESGPSFNVLALGAVQTEMLEEAFPGYEAPTTAAEMARYISNFALTAHHLYNGKMLQVSNSTP